MLSHAPEDRPSVYDVGKALSCLSQESTASLEAAVGYPAEVRE